MQTVRKWQRIKYMPATALGSDGHRVTGSREHADLARRAAREGMVLLKNARCTLPFDNGTKLAVFGKAQADYVKGGGGSGDTTVAYERSLLSGLQEKESEGRLTLFAPLSAYYTADTAEQYLNGCSPGKTVEPPIPDTLLEQAKTFTDTALITISRYSCEGSDRVATPFDGDFYLSHEEALMVETVQTNFMHVVVVLNVGGIVDTRWFRDNDQISAALLAWQGGIEGGSAAADILCGDECPSGRLKRYLRFEF